MTTRTANLVRHIFESRINDTSDSNTKFTLQFALDIFNYAVEDNIECLNQFDYIDAEDIVGIEEEEF